MRKKKEMTMMSTREKPMTERERSTRVTDPKHCRECHYIGKKGDTYPIN